MSQTAHAQSTQQRVRTASAVRALQAALLVLFAAFQLAAFATSILGEQSELARALWPFDRLAHWHFFTRTRTEQVEYRFEGFSKQEDQDKPSWHRLPMEHWYPARWESGPRWYALGWSRDVAIPPLGQPKRLKITHSLLDAACRRVNVQKTRYVKLTSQKRLGGQPSELPTRQVLATRTCRR